MNKSRAFTLVEILVVTAIVGTIAVILTLAFRPAKDKALEAHFRAELQQLSAAINIYMGDYDDRYPTRLRALKAHMPETPIKPTKLKEPLPNCFSNVYYNYTRNIDVLRGEARYTAQYPFDIRVDPIIKAPFFCKTTGAMKDRIFLDGDGNPVKKVRQEWLQLGVRLDGRTAWFDEGALWEQEFALKAHSR